MVVLKVALMVDRMVFLRAEWMADLRETLLAELMVAHSVMLLVDTMEANWADQSVIHHRRPRPK